jgi:transcriptional regulator with XRE-family HTH domain
MDTKTESGLRIKACRKNAGLKQREVCDSIPGLTVTRLSNWENGLRMLSIDEAKRLAPVLETTAGYLLTIDNDPGDKRLQSLIAKYKMLDERGKTALHRVAESECEYIVSAPTEQKDAA